MPEMQDHPRYRRAAHVSLSWQNGSLVCTSAITGRRCAVSAAVAVALDQMGGDGDVSGSGAEDSSRSPTSTLPRPIAGRLLAAGIIEPVGPSADVRLGWWTTNELTSRSRYGHGKRRKHLDSLTMPSPTLDVSGPRLPLRPPPRDPSMAISFGEVLRRRRSRREFLLEEVSFELLSAFLTNAAGVQWLSADRAVSRRPYPSGGARHPLEIYLISVRCAELDCGLYYFDPSGSLVRHQSRDRFPRDFSRGVLAAIHDAGISPAVAPAGILLITAVYGRTLWKYQEFGLSVVHRDAGALLQTLYLEAEALGIGGYAIGGGPDQQIGLDLGLEPVHHGYLGAFAFGHVNRRAVPLAEAI
ncbi:SagB/ThcOx family dehydrogenase [Parafrankia elaeagni]|uniref:SagB/ThcOx family dehydrogenase n=1 Tax=Parafrankia elaeagni TaxID=222534 RepID=UPI0009FD6A02|nr:SagB/ThcOx family dehydrogenase [Parafrankia elaeagni]